MRIGRNLEAKKSSSLSILDASSRLHVWWKTICTARLGREAGEIQWRTIALYPGTLLHGSVTIAEFGRSPTQEGFQHENFCGLSID
jgi:hypothetical protein